MQKDIEHGARTTGRFALDGTECKVVFSSPFRCFEVKNEGTSDIIVSLDSGKTAADNGVVVIAAQTSATLAHMRSDVSTLYLTGVGNVQVLAKNEPAALFRAAGGGGGSVTINGSVVTASPNNGNIKIDGAEVVVYDDTDIKEQLADISSGVSPTVVENENNTDELYKLDITDVNGTFTTPNLIGKTGAQGIQGAKGDKGDTGEQGLQGIQGIKGDKGDDGYPFLIYKEYSSLDEFDAAHFPEIGLMFMVKTGENFPVYRYTGDVDTPYSFVTELATSEGIKGEKGDKGDTGEQGIQGEAGKDGADGTTYIPSIGTVESTETASVSVEVNEDTKQAVFNFGLPKGADGADGEKAVQFTPVITEDNELAWENDGGLDNPPTVPIQQIFSNAPIGTVLSFAGSTAPKGYLVCDGQSVAVADYPDLYAVIGNTYGGDTASFNVPDYRETVLVGVGENTTDTIASHDVYELGEFKDDQLQGHEHNTYKNYESGATGGAGTVTNHGGVIHTLDIVSDGTNGEPRIGTTTHGKQKGVTYIIKAKNEGVDSGLNDEMIEYVDNAVATARTNPYADYEMLNAKAHTAGQSSIFVGYTKPASFVITPSEYAVVITDKRDIPLYSGNITIGDSSTMAIAWDNDNVPSDVSLVGSAAGQVSAFGMLLKVKECTAILLAKTAPATEMVVTGLQTTLTSADVFECMSTFMKYNVYVKKIS